MLIKTPFFANLSSKAAPMINVCLLTVGKHVDSVILNCRNKQEAVKRYLMTKFVSKVGTCALKGYMIRILTIISMIKELIATLN